MSHEVIPNHRLTLVAVLPDPLKLVSPEQEPERVIATDAFFVDGGENLIVTYRESHAM